MRWFERLLIAGAVIAAAQAAMAVLAGLLLAGLIYALITYPQETMGFLGLCLLVWLFQHHPIVCVAVAIFLSVLGLLRKRF